MFYLVLYSVLVGLHGGNDLFLESENVNFRFCKSINRRLLIGLNTGAQVTKLSDN